MHVWVLVKNGFLLGLQLPDPQNQPPKMGAGPKVLLPREHRGGGAPETLPTRLALQ